MYLRSHLGFLGVKEENTIIARQPGILDSTIEIDVDDFDKVWSYLKLISNLDYNSSDVINWMNKNNVSEDEKNSFDEFLKFYNLVHTNYDKNQKNIRTINFLNNYSESNSRDYSYELIPKDKYVVIIGLGTIGTSVVNYLIQFGITKFVLIDGDSVESKNINHQRYFSLKDVGQSKVNVLSRELKKYSSEVNIIAIDKNLTTVDQLSSLNINDIELESIFCCFDGNNHDILKEILEFSNNLNISPYISAYNKSSILSSILNEKIINNIESDYTRYSSVISENSGIGIMGDLSALLMVRLWIQNKIEVFDLGFDSLEYDFFNHRSKSLESNILISKLPNYTANNKYIEEYILKYKVEKLYSEFLESNNTNKLYEIETIQEKYDIDIDFEEDSRIKEYIDILKELKLEVKKEEMNVIEFAKLKLSEKIDDIVILEKNNNLLKSLESKISEALILKKEKHMEYYESIWRKYSEYKELYKKINDNFTKLYSGKIIDFNDYQPNNYKFHSYSISNQIEEVMRLDEILPELNMREYIEFLISHNFIDISKSINKSFHRYDFRTKNSYIKIRYTPDVTGMMTLAHEVGHAYFVSMISNASIIEDINDDIKEVFACTNEFLLHFSLLKRYDDNLNLKSDLFYSLYESIIPNLSMDTFEEEIMRLDNSDINWNNIINIREKDFEELPVEIINSEYSNYNTALNLELLFNKRSPYMYLNAYLIGFKLAKIIIENPNKYFEFVTYLHDLDKAFDMNSLLNIFNLNYENFNDIVDEFIDYIKFLKL
ncbi:ThiF family adenylyltransferase [Macrococcoides caseolyticum]|uniref:ThiF family adenylyltransferase n=3 Tax=Macrococcoides caseolyticum TaxID=69966 RepID=UPI000C328AB0|nr:ThiF family adenylyltransferase [Macrococcus caseolyticus]PKE16097.1 hypothetical protein CW718_11415 [Macrococcus caseolyticus]PKE66858.1 hypothetical protein CW663_11060 [Macrococcus caseolyticus]